MADFDVAVMWVLKNEGELNNENVDHDAGGLTKHGISLRFLKEVPAETLKRYGIWDHEVSEQTIEDLTIDQAKKIYYHEFWKVAAFEEINSQIIANYVFDMCINMGIAQGIKLVQRAIWAILFDYQCLLDDGVLGPKTLTALNEVDLNVMAPLVAERAGFYRLLVATRTNQGKFLNGWLNRAYRIS